MQGLMFKAPLTIANLEGRKIRTSRMKGLKKINEKPDEWKFISAEVDGSLWLRNLKTYDLVRVKCPFGQAGSELYGKETYGDTTDITLPPIIYRADPIDKRHNCEPKWRSPMMMPESASRYHIILEKIIFQRIQEISEADSRAEGVLPDLTKNTDGWRTLIDDFRELWDSINHNWDSNPWVWGLYYRVVKKEGK